MESKTQRYEHAYINFLRSEEAKDTATKDFDDAQLNQIKAVTELRKAIKSVSDNEEVKKKAVHVSHTFKVAARAKDCLRNITASYEDSKQKLERADNELHDELRGNG